MTNDAQDRWTLLIVMAIGGLFGLYTTIMVTYFTDGLPEGITPLFLITGVTPIYLGILGLLECCWFWRWRALGD